MATYEELMQSAEQIRTNELPESNTHQLVGQHLKNQVEHFNKEGNGIKSLIEANKKEVDKKLTELETRDLLFSLPEEIDGKYISKDGNLVSLGSTVVKKYRIQGVWIDSITYSGVPKAGLSASDIAIYTSDDLTSANCLAKYTLYTDGVAEVKKTISIPKECKVVAITDRKDGNVKIGDVLLTINRQVLPTVQIDNYIPYGKVDLTNVTWGKYLGADGGEITLSGIGYTDYIPILPNTTYTIEGFMYPSGGCLYDSAKKRIKGLSFRSDADKDNFESPSNAYYARINVRQTPETVYRLYDSGHENSYYFKDLTFDIPELEELGDRIDAVEEESENNSKQISDIKINYAQKTELSKKADKTYIKLFDYNREGFNQSYPFWPQGNSSSGRWQYVQFNITPLKKFVLNSIRIAGAYVVDGTENIGSGNLSVRIYKGVQIINNKSDFTDAELLRKSTVDVSIFYENSTKAAAKEELVQKLSDGEFGYTEFAFEDLTVEENETLYVYFGVDDDNIYTNTPISTHPSCMFSIVTNNRLSISGYINANTDKPTFLANGSEALFLSQDSSIKMEFSGLEVTTNPPHVGYITIDSRDEYTFVGAFNKVLDALFTAKPDARVAMIGHNTLSGMSKQSGLWHKPLVKVQEQIAEYWGCHYLPLWKHLNWVKNDNVNTFKTWCPDEIHPYTNETKVSTAIGNMSIADYAIHNFVKEWLRPIFGDEWEGKKVATYGTSIPYGGKYTILAVRELGGTAENYCEAGSVIRRGKTDGAPPSVGSFTNTEDSARRNYKKDMLDLIGTENEPDLFVFDFGINDYNLDQTDFDLSDW